MNGGIIIEYESILEKIIPIIMGAITTFVLPLLAAISTRYIRRIKNERLRESLDHVRDVAFDTVQSIMQTQDISIKKFMNDGKLDEDEKRILKQMAIDNIISSATNESVKYLQRRKVDLGKYLDTLVESTVYEVKQDEKIISQK